jgi:hypothetical protein
MKNRILLLILIAGLAVNQTFSQCGTISMIGEFNGWAEDYPMYPYYQDSSIYQAFIYLDDEDDVNLDGIVELKFRQDAGWSINWGSQDFPEGVGVQNGANIPAVYGNYFVTFNCLTGYYLFFSTCGAISLIGEFNEYNGDLFMDRSYEYITLFTQNVNFTEEDDMNMDGFVDIKFRENADWANNWGGTGFPNGYGIQNGPVLPVPYGNYNVSFDCETLNYFFSGPIGISSLGQDLPRVSVYPNPATNFTTIEYLMDQPGYVILEICNHTGQLVATLADEWQPSGPHQFNWNAEGCPKGMYFYRLSVAKNTTSGKLVLH